jgi:metal-dependent amidase/aminoacylase/carboxypeptidase family protein
MTITSAARELQPELTRFRHAMHQEPEIGLDLPRTQEKVLRALDGLPYEITLGKETTSVTAVLRGTGGAAGMGEAGQDQPAPSVLLRADMDGLPVQEKTGVDYTSRWTAPCTPAATTSTRPCSPAPPRCWRRTGTAWRATSS